LATDSKHQVRQWTTYGKNMAKLSTTAGGSIKANVAVAVVNFSLSIDDHTLGKVPHLSFK